MECEPVLDEIQTTSRDHYDVAAALDTLFLKSNCTPNARTTPTRGLNNIDWPVFNEILAHLISLALDLPPDVVVVQWSDSIFDEARSLLDSSNSLGYDKSVPILRIYKQYTWIMQELKVTTHPLSLVLSEGRSGGFTPSEQESIKSSIKQAFHRALEFHRLHLYMLNQLQQSFLRMDEAERNYANALDTREEEVAPDLLQTQISDLHITCESRKIELRQLKSRAVELSRLTSKISEDLRPVQTKISTLESSVNYKKHELQSLRQNMKPTATPDDISKLTAEKQLLKDTMDERKHQFDQLSHQCNLVKKEIHKERDLIENSLKPIRELIQHKILPCIHHINCEIGQTLNEVTADRNSSECALSADNSRRKSTINEYQSQLCDKQEALKLIETRVQTLSSELEELRLELERKPDYEKEVENLTQEYTMLNKLIRDRSTQFEKMKKRMQNTTRQFQELRKTVVESQYAKHNANELGNVIENISEKLRLLAN